MTYLKYAFAPGPTVPNAEAGPLSGTVPPIRISFEVTPGVAAGDAARGERERGAREERERCRSHRETGLRRIGSIRRTGPSEIRAVVGIGRLR